MSLLCCWVYFPLMVQSSGILLVLPLMKQREGAIFLAVTANSINLLRSFSINNLCTTLEKEELSRATH